MDQNTHTGMQILRFPVNIYLDYCTVAVWVTEARSGIEC